MTIVQRPIKTTNAPTVRDLFVVASQIGLFSIGGGMSAWIHREMVVKRGWMEEQAFHADMAAARILPGTNVSNFFVLAGYRLAGPRGALAGLLGILAGPIVLILVLAALREKFDGPLLSDLLLGAAAAAVGFMVPMVVHSTRQIGAHWTSFIIIVVIASAVGVFGAPMALSIAVILPISIALTIWWGK